MVAGDFLGGLLQGIAQGRARKQDLEEKKLMRGQKETEAKRKAEKEKFYMDLIRQQIGGGETPTTPTTPTSPSGADISGLTPQGEAGSPPEGSDIIQQIAQAQTGGAPQGQPQGGGLGNISPLIAALMKKGSGIDVPGALRIQGTSQRDKNRQFQLASEVTYVPVKHADGSTTQEQRFKYPELRRKLGMPDTLGGGQPSGSIGGVGRELSPKLVKKVIPPTNIPLYLNESLDTPPVGTTIEEAQDQGFKRFDTGTKQKLQEIRGADDLINQLEKQMNIVFPKTGEGPVGRVGGALKRTIGAAAQTDVEAASLRDFMKGTMAPFIRAMGEKGTLSDSDMARAKALLPKLTDSAEVAEQKLTNLKSFFRDKYLTTYGGTESKKAPPDTDIEAIWESL